MPVNVCIARCDDYSADSVAAAFDRVLEPLGGIDWAQPGMTVAIKTNLVSRMSPDTAAVTHPTLLAELTRRLTARGARVIVGDSPGGPYTAAWVHSVYNGTLMEAVVKAGGELNPKYPGGTQAQRLKLEAEGHTIIQRGRKNIRYYVKDYEKAMHTLI